MDIYLYPSVRYKYSFKKSSFFGRRSGRQRDLSREEEIT